ncbi:hypothetical protein N431DRAFT_461292 [Stipitochalara longipes BDJ]|nr:hypothetical protein N431DRAFT_461292 [Stipitochalara longipes BDJ]
MPLQLPENTPLFALLLAALLYSTYRSLCVANAIHKAPHVLEWEAAERGEIPLPQRESNYNKLAQQALLEAQERARALKEEIELQQTGVGTPSSSAGSSRVGSPRKEKREFGDEVRAGKID